MKEFNQFYNLTNLYYPNPSSVLLNHEHLFPKGGMALDLGCGDGRNSLYLASLGFHVYSYDLSSEGINKILRVADENNFKITANVDDVSNLSFHIDSFDIIVASTIFDHLEKEKHEKLINNVKKWIKPKGFIYAGVFTTDDPAFKLRNNELNEDKLNQVSETQEFIKYFFKHNELFSYFEEFSKIYYNECIKEDLSHGKPHFHGLARILTQRPI